MKPAEFPPVLLIVIHWNQKELTVESLNSLKAIQYPNFNIALVDNGSSDGSGEEIVKLFDDIILIRSKENIGYAGGANLGFAYGMKTDAQYFFLLNNDIAVDPEILNHLVTVMEDTDNRGVGICAPKIYYHRPSDLIWFAGGVCDMVTGLCSHLGIGQKDNASNSVLSECSFINGCAMFIRKEVFHKVGMFDTSYFHTSEDLDFSLRSMKQGLKLLFVPEAKMWHKIRSSTGGYNKPNFFYNYYEFRNRILIFKNFFLKESRASALFSLFYFYLRTVYYHIRDCNFKGALGILHGTFHGIIGRTGR